MDRKGEKNSSRSSDYYRQLAQRQIAARDPGIKKRRLAHTVAQRERSRKSESLGQMLGGLSNKIKGVLIGFILALTLWIVLAILFTETWVDMVGIVALVLFPCFGFITGHAFDIRDNLRDF